MALVHEHDNNRQIEENLTSNDDEILACLGNLIQWNFLTQVDVKDGINGPKEFNFEECYGNKIGDF